MASDKAQKIFNSTHDFRGVDDATSPLRPIYTHVPRFEPGSREASAYLEEHGYVVLKQCLAPEEAKHAVDLTWDYLTSLNTGVDRADPKTWVDEKWPTVVHGAILSFHGIGHCDAQWYIRERPRVKQAFAGVWGTDDLLTSFDGMSIFRPWKLNPAWRTNPSASWLHIDQHPIYSPGFKCVQGLVNLLPMHPSIGGNVLIPKSHMDFPNIKDKYPERVAKVPRQIDHFRYPANDPLLTTGAKNHPIMCHLEVGDMLLWDSRTIHCSGPGLEDPATADPVLARAVSLVCMMPRSLCPEEVMEIRKRAPLERKSTTNWSDRWIPLDESDAILAHKDMEKYPDTEGYKYAILDPPRLTPYQLKLVGFTDEEIRNGTYPHTIQQPIKSRL